MCYIIMKNNKKVISWKYFKYMKKINQFKQEL